MEILRQGAVPLGSRPTARGFRDRGGVQRALAGTERKGARGEGGMGSGEAERGLVRGRGRRRYRAWRQCRDLGRGKPKGSQEQKEGGH